MRKQTFYLAGLLALVAVYGKAEIGAITETAASALQSVVSCANGSSINFDSNTLVIDCTNNRVGIGTASPGTKLHMSSGTLTVDGTSAHLVIGGTAADLNYSAVMTGGIKSTGGSWSISGTLTNAAADPITHSTWTATYSGGSAHVCVNNSGVLFVSEAACP